MISRNDFTQPPASDGPRQRLIPSLARGKARDISHLHRAVPPIEAITVRRINAVLRHGDGARIVEISLARVKFLERPAP